jgi:hypothetical protein
VKEKHQICTYISFSSQRILDSRRLEIEALKLFHATKKANKGWRLHYLRAVHFLFVKQLLEQEAIAT